MEFNELLYFVCQANNNKNKIEIVSILNAKGFNVDENTKYEEIFNIVKNLKTTESALQTTKLNCIAGEKKIINFGRDLSDLKFATSILKFQQGQTDVTEKICSYNNSDSTNFVYDINKTIFDGQMKPKNNFNISPSSTSDLGVAIESTYFIDFNNYKNIQGFDTNDDDNTLIVKAIMSSCVLYGKGNIDIRNIEKLKKINLNMQGYKVLLSFDNGTTWKSYYNNEWVDVDINNLDDVKQKSMDKALLDTLTDVQLEPIRNGSNTIKLAYYQEQNNISDVIYTDELDLIIDMKGRDVIANQSDWSYRIYNDGTSVEYTFNTAGTFTINRI